MLVANHRTRKLRNECDEFIDSSAMAHPRGQQKGRRKAAIVLKPRCGRLEFVLRRAQRYGRHPGACHSALPPFAKLSRSYFGESPLTTAMVWVGGVWERFAAAFAVAPLLAHDSLKDIFDAVDLIHLAADSLKAELPGQAERRMVRWGDREQESPDAVLVACPVHHRPHRLGRV